MAGGGRTSGRIYQSFHLVRPRAIALSLLLQVAVVNLEFLNLAFGTVPLEFNQWLLCAAMSSVVLGYSELRKLASCAWSRRDAPTGTL